MCANAVFGGRPFVRRCYDLYGFLGTGYHFQGSNNRKMITRGKFKDVRVAQTPELKMSNDMRKMLKMVKFPTARTFE